MLTKRNKIIKSTIALMVCGTFSFGFTSTVLANEAELNTTYSIEETIEAPVTQETKKVSDEDIKKVEKIKEEIKRNISTFNKFKETRLKNLNIDIERNTASHQATIKNYRISIASHMSGKVTNADRQKVAFYRKLIEREKNQCNSENSQKKRDAKEEIFRAEQDMKRKNVELKKQLSMILGEQNVDSVLDGIDASEFAEDYDGGLIYGFSD